MWHLKKNTVERWSWAVPITEIGCKNTIELCNKLDLTYPLADLSSNIVRPFQNKSATLPITDDSRWIFETTTKVLLDINEKFFNYDLLYIDELRFCVYEEGDYYDKHTEMQYESTGVKKISFLINLSDPDTYEGGDLLMHFDKEPTVAKRDLGSMMIFPSFYMSEITPVTSGTKYCIMGSVIGPKFT
jgi:PKHD-type hydroxylase